MLALGILIKTREATRKMNLPYGVDEALAQCLPNCLDVHSLPIFWKNDTLGEVLGHDSVINSEPSISLGQPGSAFDEGCYMGERGGISLDNVGGTSSVGCSGGS